MITFWIKKLRPKAINSHLDGIRGFYKAQACETEWRSISSSLQGVRIAALSSNRDVSLPRLDVHHNYGYRGRRSGRNQDVSWNYTQPPYTLPGYSPHRFTDPPLSQKEGGPADSGPRKWGTKGYLLLELHKPCGTFIGKSTNRRFTAGHCRPNWITILLNLSV